MEVPQIVLHFVLQNVLRRVRDTRKFIVFAAFLSDGKRDWRPGQDSNLAEMRSCTTPALPLRHRADVTITRM